MCFALSGFLLFTLHPARPGRHAWLGWSWSSPTLLHSSTEHDLLMAYTEQPLDHPYHHKHSRFRYPHPQRTRIRYKPELQTKNHHHSPHYHPYPTSSSCRPSHRPRLARLLPQSTSTAQERPPFFPSSPTSAGHAIPRAGNGMSGPRSPSHPTCRFPSMRCSASLPPRRQDSTPTPSTRKST